jgi:hypothetical protein
MAWFDDLTPCDYFGLHQTDALRAVGWLERGHQHSTGKVASEVFAKLVELCHDPWQPVFWGGAHPCDLCVYRAEASCSANVFVPGDGVLYVSPILIAHYMNAHGYAPPTAFCRAVLTCPPMRSIAYFKSVLASGGRPLVQSADAVRLAAASASRYEPGNGAKDSTSDS